VATTASSALMPLNMRVVAGCALMTGNGIDVTRSSALSELVAAASA